MNVGKEAVGRVSRRRTPWLLAVAGILVAGCLPIAPAPLPSCAGRDSTINMDNPQSGVRLQTGRSFSICGTGFGSGRSVVFTLHSTPIPLGGLNTDGSGLVTGTLSIPADAPEGAHTIVGDSGIKSQSVPVTVLSDITAPQLASFSLSPTSINTGAGPATITVTAGITDDLSGTMNGISSLLSQVRFQSPNGQLAGVSFNYADRISGTPTNGTFQSNMTIPFLAEHGTWTIEYIYLIDEVGNSRWLSAAQLRALGFPTTFEQTSPGDITAPQLVSFSLSPTSINTGAGPATITVTAGITDDLSGNYATDVLFQSPNGQFAYASLANTDRISGTPTNGTFQSNMTIPFLAAHGTWTIEYIYLIDEVGNSRWLSAAQLRALGFPTTFKQTSPGDITAPQLVSFSLSPTSINTGAGPATITVTAGITDDLSGTGNDGGRLYGEVRFLSPNGQLADATFYGARISGTPTNGTFQTNMTIPFLAEHGTWTIQYIHLIDEVGNSRYLSAAQLRALGFPTTFEQTSP